MEEGLLRYDFGAGVEAFSTRKGSETPYRVLLGKQVHDIKTVVIRDADIDPAHLEGTDALVTNLKAVAIGVKTADCIPVLMYDPIEQVIAASHAGWKGTLRRIVSSTVSAMSLEFGCKPSNLKVMIGPGISVDSFQVGEEIPLAFKDLGFPMDRIYSWKGGKIEGNPATGHHIDLIEANKWVLEGLGVNPDNIISCGIDNFTDPSFYSARRDGLDAGRIITAIRLV